MAQIERGEAKIQRRISIKRALDCKVGSGVLVQTLHCFGVPGCFGISKKFLWDGPPKSVR